MAEKRITFVTKQEQMSKLGSGSVHIVLRPNLRIRSKNKGNKIGKRWTFKMMYEYQCKKIKREF